VGSGGLGHLAGGIRADGGKSGVGSLGDKNEVEILYRRNKVRSANQHSGRPVESSGQWRMGSSSGFPIAYA
jgi:hypothetical protein